MTQMSCVWDSGNADCWSQTFLNELSMSNVYRLRVCWPSFHRNQCARVKEAVIRPSYFLVIHYLPVQRQHFLPRELLLCAHCWLEQQFKTYILSRKSFFFKKNIVSSNTLYNLSLRKRSQDCLQFSDNPKYQMIVFSCNTHVSPHDVSKTTNS